MRDWYRFPGLSGSPQSVTYQELVKRIRDFVTDFPRIAVTGLLSVDLYPPQRRRRAKGPSMRTTHLVVLHGCCKAPKAKRTVVGESVYSGVAVGVPENRVIAPYYACVLNSTLLKAGVARTVLPQDCKVFQSRHPHREAEKRLLRQRSEYLTDLQEEEEAYIESLTGARRLMNGKVDLTPLPGDVTAAVEWGREEFVHLRMPDVTAYLAHPALRDSTLDKVAEQLPSEAYVMVAHSLGSVIAYELLYRALSSGARGVRPPNAFVTVDSPLGLKTFTDRLPDAKKVADAMPYWLNVRDRKDLATRFRMEANFPVDETVVVNRSSADHDLYGYLTAPEVAKRVRALVALEREAHIAFRGETRLKAKHAVGGSS